MLKGIQIAKRGISMDIQKFIPDCAKLNLLKLSKLNPNQRQQKQKPAPLKTIKQQIFLFLIFQFLKYENKDKSLLFNIIM